MQHREVIITCSCGQKNRLPKTMDLPAPGAGNNPSTGKGCNTTARCGACKRFFTIEEVWVAFALSMRSPI